MAIRRHYDAIGVFVLALACGLGGGLLRDCLFIQSGPPAAMRNARLHVCRARRLRRSAILFFRHMERLSKPFLIFDALGKAPTGSWVRANACEAGLAVPACIFVGVVNAVGSGLIRDVLVREEPLMFKPGQFYVIASLLGVSAFMLSAAFLHVQVLPAAIIGIAITFIFRLLAILFDWQTRSVWRRSPS